tara:strand:+ start:7644 stop:9044 length:1401 start_codon:yes stop_codon:yes gene_type:complete
MKKISEIIRECESTCNPHNINCLYKGKKFEVYPWIKPHLFSKLQQGEKPGSNNDSKIFQLRNIFSGYRFFFGKYKTLILSNSLERRKLGDHIYDKLFHYISSHKDLLPSLTIESKFPSNHYPLSDYKNKNCVSRSIFFLKEYIFLFFKARNIKIVEIDSLEKFISNHDLKIDINYIIRKNIAQYYIWYKFLKKRPKIKFLFITVSYTNFGLIKACKELNILVIEIQHGVINSEHYGYNYFYNPIENQFPDYILTLGEGDSNFFDLTTLRKIVSVKSVGSFVIDYFIENHNSNSNPLKKVTISLQDCETGVKSVNNFIKLAELNPDIIFYFKRRRLPLNFYQDNFNFPSNVILDSDKNIYELIIDSFVHITAYSSCALEAPSLGIRNILCNTDNKSAEYYTKKLKEGEFNYYCNTLKEMNEALNQCLNSFISKEKVMKNNKHNIIDNYSKNIDLFLKNNILNDFKSR